MNEDRHIINRHILEITVPERERVQQVQNKTSEIVRNRLYPELDKLFSKITDREQVVRIDKLVVDIGNISEDELDNIFVEKAVNEIEEKVTGLLRNGPKTKGTEHVNGFETEFFGKIVVSSKQDDYLEQFKYFLQFGYLPWWNSSSKENVRIDKKNSITEVFEEVLKYDSNFLKNELLPLFGNALIRKRLIFQFGNVQLNSLLKRINQAQFKNHDLQFQILQSLIGSARIEKTIAKTFYDIVFQYFSSEKEIDSEKQKIEFVRDLLESLISKLSEEDKEWIRINRLGKDEIQDKSVTRELYSFSESEKIIEDSNLEPVLNKTDNNWKAVSKLVKQVFVRPGESAVRKRKSEKEISAESKADLSSAKTELSGNKSREKTFTNDLNVNRDNTENILVFNAGLVLFHPFLRYFYDGLNLLSEKLNFKSLEHAYKAVHLLQFVATGNETADETELLLNKILCGLDISEPVPLSVPLSNEEEEECINLIITVLERWEALKTSNPAALRETYIQREGLLEQNGNSLSLKIERNTFDVMLDKLPWGISLIKLPWSEQMIYVEW